MVNEIHWNLMAIHGKLHWKAAGVVALCELWRLQDVAVLLMAGVRA